MNKRNTLEVLKMAGGKATAKKDERLKVSQGQPVTTGKILSRGINTFKAGINAQGLGAIHALCNGTVYFTKKKTPHGKVRTYINVKPASSTA